MSRDCPWDTGDVDANWEGYFLPDTDVLRNRVGATTVAGLAAAENDLVEIRVAELRADSTPVPRTYDLVHLQAVHRYLFQDVFEWAGELRTVGIEKAGESFIPPLDIARPVAHVADEIARTDQLRGVADAQLPDRLAYLYDYINFAHPFREGNGRTQREFFDQLMSESGRGLAWNLIGKTELHHACHVARAAGDLEPLCTMFARIVDNEPAYLYP
ncbi:cell filamentation protein Fic (plasmid) [Prescottella equi]|uniref:Fic/DOC family protein n=1 Tax=Rhodococcus hoagii TaxID=43767 RepID=UPI001C74832C|nr:Fic family protein [Prescottella equi]BCN66504.1 cell filamentation protein Fic [Prescottella equi]